MRRPSLDAVLADDRDAIVAAVIARMTGDDAMSHVAEQRDLSQSQLLSQVVGFWLEGIRTDLALGGTAAMSQNLAWLRRYQQGNGLAFDGDSVRSCFGALCAEIEPRLGSDAQRHEYSVFRIGVERLIDDSFSL
jgi:hypothetical protein